MSPQEVRRYGWWCLLSGWSTAGWLDTAGLPWWAHLGFGVIVLTVLCSMVAATVEPLTVNAWTYDTTRPPRRTGTRRG